MVKNYTASALRMALKSTADKKDLNVEELKLNTDSVNISSDKIKSVADDNDLEMNDDELNSFSSTLNSNFKTALRHQLRFVGQKVPNINKEITFKNKHNFEQQMHKMFSKDEWSKLGLDIGEDTSGEIPEWAPALVIHDEYTEYAYESQNAVRQRFKDFGMNIDIYDGGEEMYVYGKDDTYFKFNEEKPKVIGSSVVVKNLIKQGAPKEYIDTIGKMISEYDEDDEDFKSYSIAHNDKSVDASMSNTKTINIDSSKGRKSLSLKDPNLKQKLDLLFDTPPVDNKNSGKVYVTGKKAVSCILHYATSEDKSMHEKIEFKAPKNNDDAINQLEEIKNKISSLPSQSGNFNMEGFPTIDVNLFDPRTVTKASIIKSSEVESQESDAISSDVMGIADTSKDKAIKQLNDSITFIKNNKDNYVINYHLKQ